MIASGPCPAIQELLALLAPSRHMLGEAVKEVARWEKREIIL
jgi:hypothetical protein